MRLTAVCIGGPMDGRLLTGDRLSWKVAERPRYATAPLPDVPVKPIEMETFTYYQVAFCDQKVWMFETLNVNEAMAMLLDKYQR